MSAVTDAFDRALASAVIDPTSLHWATNARNTLCVRISGVEYRTKVALPSPASVRDAIAECLRQHCTRVAVENAAAELKL